MNAFGGVRKLVRIEGDRRLDARKTKCFAIRFNEHTVRIITVDS